MKKSFVVRIDEETYKLLEKWAQDEFRSVNGQIEYLLNDALIKNKRKGKSSAKDSSEDSQKEK